MFGNLFLPLLISSEIDLCLRLFKLCDQIWFLSPNLLAGDDHRHDHDDDKDVQKILQNPVAAECIVG